MLLGAPWAEDVPYIAGRLALQGGGQPQDRAARKILAKCRKKDWYPSKQSENVGGRPPEVARVAMGNKRSLVRPTPALCRARLPRKTINKRTGNPISDRTVQRVFKALCFDEKAERASKRAERKRVRETGKEREDEQGKELVISSERLYSFQG